MRHSVDHVNQKAGKPAATSATATPAGDDVLEAVHAVMHLARARQQALLRDSPHGLSGMEGRVLGFFARHPGATQTELAAHTGRDKGQLARLIAALRERGLLEGQADAADRRSTRLHLSDAAQALHHDMQRLRQAMAAQAAKGLTVAERQQLVALLAKLRANLEA